MRLRRFLLVMGALTLLTSMEWSAPAHLGATPTSRANVELIDVHVSLRDRSVIVSGVVRNSGPVVVSNLVIDAWGYGIHRDVAAFGSDGIPWAILPTREEPFEIFLPLGHTLMRTLVVQVSRSRPALARGASISKTLSSTFYRALALREVRVDVDVQLSSAVVRAFAEGFPVESVTVSITFLVTELQGFILRAMRVEVPAGGSVRVSPGAAIAKVHQLRVIDVTFSPPW